MSVLDEDRCPYRHAALQWVKVALEAPHFPAKCLYCGRLIAHGPTGTDQLGPFLWFEPASFGQPPDECWIGVRSKYGHLAFQLSAIASRILA